MEVVAIAALQAVVERFALRFVRVERPSRFILETSALVLRFIAVT